MNSAGIAVEARSNLWRALTDPRVDRAIATAASLPFVYMVYHRLVVEGADLPRLAMSINFALLIATMVARRPPVRVTPNPLYWATAFVATYWGFMTVGLMERGAPIAPLVVTHGLAVASLAVSLFARVSLGRNIGFVPAQRELVSSGAYAFVRHPIYSGLFLSLTGVALRAYSPRNLLIVAIPAALFVIKTFMEEDFLSEDPAYVRYTKTVRSRWIPLVA
jgi:protein-S-isoprenylcysteine O-methyltransferase Ste14